MDQQPQALTVEFDVAATMRDGTLLRANVYRPTEGQWPVLLTRLPYGKDGLIATGHLDPVQSARRGYVVIVQDTRGRARSDGDWYPWRYEAEDGADTVAWAAALPYSDGQVGMWGQSYFGATQWAAATQQPSALKAIIPVEAPIDPLNGLWYRGGAFHLGVAASWNLHMGFDVLVRRYRNAPSTLGEAVRTLSYEIDNLAMTGDRSLPLAQFAPLRRQDAAPAFFDVVATPPVREERRWDVETIVGKHDRVQVPTYNIGGWYDLFLADTIASFQAMRVQGKPTKLLIGPFIHGITSSPVVGQLNFGFGAQLGFIDLQMDFTSLQLRWFDHWLKGVDTGLLDEPPIKLFVMGANVWRNEDEWPLARAVDTAHYLREGGWLTLGPPGAEDPDRYTYDPANPVPTLGGPLLMAPEYPAGPFDQRPIESRPDVLVFTSSPLRHDTEVTGPIRVRLWAASSAPDTDFVARLVDVYPDGRSINLTDGIVRARYRNVQKGELPTLIEPGRPHAYDIDLWATSNVFKAGHQVGLQITSSCFPRWDRNPNTGHTFGVDAELKVAHQTILHDREHPSHVVLPLVPA